jgi:hypothetical protein
VETTEEDLAGETVTNTDVTAVPVVTVVGEVTEGRYLSTIFLVPMNGKKYSKQSS